MSRLRERLPEILSGAAALWLLASFFAPAPRGYDFALFGRLPVLQEGRVKPLDTVARTSLLFLRGKQSLYNGERSLSAVEWMLDVMARPKQADAYADFVIDDPDLLGMLGLPSTGRYFSFNDLQPAAEAIAAQAERVEPVEPARRSRFQSAVAALNQRVSLYRRLRATLQPPGAADFPSEIAGFEKAAAEGAPLLASRIPPHGRKALETLAADLERYRRLSQSACFDALPPLEGEPSDAWRTVGDGLLGSLQGAALHPGVEAYAQILKAYADRSPARFNSGVSSYAGRLEAWLPRTLAVAGHEAAFNRYEPFYKGMILYLAALLLAFGAWLGRPKELGRAAYFLLAAAFAVHTGGLAARILLQGRPPVTNLYSSAVFVGWTAVALGIALERLLKRGFGTVVASTVGFATLIIAHHLSAGGDTMEAMRAVLDSNFWLTTHVVTITMGYGGCFLAGMLAHLYILRGVLTRSLDEESARVLERMTYGTVCFALFFSFLGTVLGGIWADQSWGRFWGWDPKENGALLIVLWNALILHALKDGDVRARGMMVLAVFGNILTSLSWFGVNMLGVGLHSYGFMEKTFIWLVAFVLSQLAVMALGALPPGYWRSRIGA